MQKVRKPKIVFLIPYPLGYAPGQRFRFEQYISFLSANFNLSYLSFINSNTYSILYSNKKLRLKIWGFTIAFLKRFFDVLRLRNSDVIFVFRESSIIGPPVFEWMLFKFFKKKIIFDFDDAIWLPNISEANKKFNWLKNPEKTSKIISYSKLVIAGNNYLADYAKKYNHNVIIIPTTIDTDYHFNKKNKINNGKITIGWTGSSTTNRHLQTLLPVINILKAKFSEHICFVMISNIPLEDTSILIQFKPWNKVTEIEDLAQFDIGIMPLPDDEWTRGKCGFKGLQYMALEIPTVMSPVGVNTEIIQDGENGFLAATEDEWIEKLSLLIESPELREKLGKAGRKTVMEKYSVEANKQKYLDAFNSVLNM